MYRTGGGGGGGGLGVRVRVRFRFRGGGGLIIGILRYPFFSRPSRRT